MFAYRLFIMCGLLCLSGCGVIDYFFMKPPTNTAQELMQAGKNAMEEQDYDKAIQYFSKLKEKFPFSPFTTQAELALADAYYFDGQYLIAEDVYKEFESLHPGDSSIAYVLFQIGKSNFKQFKSIDLPQDNIKEALQYFQRVVQSFPESSYASEAKDYVQKCRSFEAEHELFVADFYWRRHQYLAAWKRYQYVVKHFNEFSEYVEYAQNMSQAAYFKYRQRCSEDIWCQQEGGWRTWFDWL